MCTVVYMLYSAGCVQCFRRYENWSELFGVKLVFLSDLREGHSHMERVLRKASYQLSGEYDHTTVLYSESIVVNLVGSLPTL